MIKDLEALVENHLNLQVKISYNDHRDFLIRHGLLAGRKILDVGTGNGTFIKRIAQEYNQIQFVGIDKRKALVDNSNLSQISNFKAVQVDLFARQVQFDYGSFDGILMRYFLLHVDHAHKILELFKEKAKRPSRLWIIDLDYSKITSNRPHPIFDLFVGLIREFCLKISLDTRGGESVLPMLKKFDYQNIIVEEIPFTSKTTNLSDFVLYLKQEIICYSRMLGRSENDQQTLEILKFLDDEVGTEKIQISYSMILISCDLK